jgi:hypothetical protein
MSICTCVCMHNMLSYFRIEIICICVGSFTKIAIDHMELNTSNMYAMVIMDMWYI